MIIQILLFTSSALAMWLITRKESWSKYGYIVGLCSQPFWLYSSFVHEQWGIFALGIFYLYSWVQGIFNFIINPKHEKII
jgi:hypothetical protein